MDQTSLHRNLPNSLSEFVASADNNEEDYPEADTWCGKFKSTFQSEQKNISHENKDLIIRIISLS